MKDKDICFVIMPFATRFDNYYTAIYRPAIEAVGLNPVRADDFYRPANIVDEIWRYTIDGTPIEILP